jgi:hypothetical protein
VRGSGSHGVGPRPALYTTTDFFILLADARNLAASPLHLNPSRYNATVFTSSTSSIFRQVGVVEVDDLVELFDVAKALAMYKPVKVEKVLVISSSGGIVDALNAAGFSVPELPREAREELRRLLSPIAAVSNPIDLTGSGVDEHFGAALEVGLTHTCCELRQLSTGEDIGEKTKRETCGGEHA